MRLYGRIIEATGWTLHQVDALEDRDVGDLFEHWSEEPPLGRVVRAYLGYRESAKSEPVDPTPKEVTDAEWRRICAELEADARKHGGPRSAFL